MAVLPRAAGESPDAIDGWRFLDATARTDSDGRFVIGPIDEGWHVLAARRAGVARGRVQTRISNGQRLKIALPARRAVEVAGRITGSPGGRSRGRS